MATAETLARRILRSEWENLSSSERAVVENILARLRGSRDVNREFLDSRSLGERWADHLASFGGSWIFILLFLGFLFAWTILNTEILGPRLLAFDPYPYVFLNLILSMLAAIQAPVILMSQNRQATRDRMEAANDYEVNLRAELEIRALHEKLQQVRDDDWKLLFELQQQMRLLESLIRPQPNQDNAALAPAPA